MYLFSQYHQYRPFKSYVSRNFLLYVFFSFLDNKKMSSTLFSSSLNSTITHENLLMSTITTASETVNAYDHQGAALYIAVILVWYSTGLAMMLFLQVRPRTLQQQFLFDPTDSSKQNRLQSLTKNPFTNYRNIQADNTTKQILNELKDPERRQRLWKIYYASTEKHDEPYPQYYQTITSDSATIDRIKRKLADIHRMDTANDENPTVAQNITARNDQRSSTISAFDSTKFFTKRFPSLRRPNDNTTASTRPPLLRGQSQSDTPSANITVEMEPLVSGKQSFVPSTNVSRKRNNLFSNRFTIEKVSDNNRNPANINQNISE